jgi:predicted Rossmann fold nucleotide-binding protein DprA/Smf involved in DNA uptake
MSIYRFLQTHSTNGAGIAAALGLPLEEVYAELARLDAAGKIRGIRRYGRGLSPWIEWEAV